MPFRVSFFVTLTGDREGGWSENYWSNLPDLPTTIGVATNARPLLGGCHGIGCQIPWVRIATVPGFRQVKLLRFPSFPASHWLPGQDADYATTGVNMKITGNNQSYVYEWMTGTPDNIISLGGHYIPTPAFTTSFNLWVAELTNANRGWSLRISDPTNVWKDVLSIDQAGVVTCLAHGYNTNDQVRISRTQNLTQANGVWKVINIDADHFSLQRWIAPTTPTPWAGRPRCRRLTPVMTPINTVQIVEATSHRRGRPPYQLTGRRKARKR